MSIVLASFIGETPLRSLINRRVIFTTIAQNIGEEIVTKYTELVQHIGNENTILLENSVFNCAIMTAMLFTIATYHNYNMVYGSRDSFAKNAKLIIMILFFIFTKNIDSVL